MAESIVTGVDHGPYPNIPDEMLQKYLDLDGWFRSSVSLFLDTETLRADRESEWQYDQHAEAIDAACKAGRITLQAANVLSSDKSPLRSWWIGSRDPVRDVPRGRS